MGNFLYSDGLKIWFPVDIFILGGHGVWDWRLGSTFGVLPEVEKLFICG